MQSTAETGSRIDLTDANLIEVKVIAQQLLDATSEDYTISEDQLTAVDEKNLKGITITSKSTGKQYSLVVSDFTARVYLNPNIHQPTDIDEVDKLIERLVDTDMRRPARTSEEINLTMAEVEAVMAADTPEAAVAIVAMIRLKLETIEVVKTIQRQLEEMGFARIRGSGGDNAGGYADIISINGETPLGGNPDLVVNLTSSNSPHHGKLRISIGFAVLRPPELEIDNIVPNEIIPAVRQFLAERKITIKRPEGAW